jgi:uncharacterized protein DUF6350
VSVPAARELFPAGAGDATGMLLLSIGYLPNAVIAATGFLAGSGFSIGPVTLSPTVFAGGPVPPVPLFAALPEHAAVWWPALFALPFAVGIAVGRRLRHAADHPVARLRGVAVAAGVVAVSFAMLGATADGHLGRGPFDPVSMHAAALSVALVLWTAVPAAVTTWFSGPRPEREHLPGLIDAEPYDEPYDDFELFEDEFDEPEPEEPVEAAPAGDAEPEPDEEPDPDEEPELPGPRNAVEESGEVARE